MDQFEEIEQKPERKAKKGRLKMKVSGRSVFVLKNESSSQMDKKK